jgi:hypothetical protein
VFLWTTWSSRIDLAQTDVRRVLADVRSEEADIYRGDDHVSFGAANSTGQRNTF